MCTIGDLPSRAVVLFLDIVGLHSVQHTKPNIDSGQSYYCSEPSSSIQSRMTVMKEA